MSVTNIVIAGLGGQGVLKASEIVVQVAFRSGLDVKKSEVHGMSQRGGSVLSDVRFGEKVWSPMVPDGEADYLVVFEPGEVEGNRAMLKPAGILITPEGIDRQKVRSAKNLNVAMLGALSRHLAFPEAAWLEAIRTTLGGKLLEENLRAFSAGRG